MNFTTNWDIQGTSFESSANAFIESAKIASNPRTLKKYQPSLNKSFKQHLKDNMRRSGMEADNFADVFELLISNNGITFVNKAPLVTQRYEYGYYNGTNDTNEEYYEEYMIQTSPRYFIRPAIQESLQEIGNIMLEEAKKEYNYRLRF